MNELILLLILLSHIYFVSCVMKNVSNNNIITITTSNDIPLFTGFL